MSETLLPSPIAIRPPVFDVAAAGEAVVAAGGKFTGHAIKTVFHMMGGAEGLFNWANSSEARRDSFYEKLLPKTIVREVQVDDRRSVDELILEMDGTPVPPPRADEKTVDADFEDADMYE